MVDSRGDQRFFELYDPDDRHDERRSWLEARKIPAALGSHKVAAPYFQPPSGLIDAVNVALAVGAPLLLTGDPGAGKTQVAYHLAWYFGEVPLHRLFVGSQTTAENLLYRFDAVAYLHAANDPQRKSEKIDRCEFVEKGPLWKAYLEQGASVVLIDEIDKASRDFPNDLLNVLDQHEFVVVETGEEVRRQDGAPPPLLVLTSNSERRLPEPFLRRCIVYHLQLAEDLLRKAIAARGVVDFPDLPEEVREKALERFGELRALDLRKKPSAGELLVWLYLLSARGVRSAEELDGPLRELPMLSALLKDHDDLSILP